MNKHIIKCSQCEKMFPAGYEYRIHWEKHLDEYLELTKFEQKTK